MWVVGEVPRLTVKNSTPWNNIWILHKSHNVLLCIYTRRKKENFSWNVEAHLNIRRFPHRVARQLDLYLRLKSVRVLRSLVKVYHRKRRSQIRSRMLLIPRLKTLAGFKMLSPLTSLTDVPSSCKLQLKGWRSALKGEAHSLPCDSTAAHITKGTALCTLGQKTAYKCWYMGGEHGGKKEHQRAHNVSESWISN